MSKRIYTLEEMCQYGNGKAADKLSHNWHCPHCSEGGVCDAGIDYCVKCGKLLTKAPKWEDEPLYTVH